MVSFVSQIPCLTHSFCHMRHGQYPYLWLISRDVLYICMMNSSQKWPTLRSRSTVLNQFFWLKPNSQHLPISPPCIKSFVSLVGSWGWVYLLMTWKRPLANIFPTARSCCWWMLRMVEVSLEDWPSSDRIFVGNIWEARMLPFSVLCLEGNWCKFGVLCSTGCGVSLWNYWSMYGMCMICCIGMFKLILD